MSWLFTNLFRGQAQQAALQQADQPKEQLPEELEDLFNTYKNPVKAESKKERFCLHFHRLVCTDVATVQMEEFEVDTLLEKGMKLGVKAAQFFAWRRTLLITGACFYAFITGIEVLFVVDPWSAKGDGAFYMQRVDPRYRKYFSGLTFWNWFQTVGLLVATIFAVVCAVVAAYMWKKMPTSRRTVQISWACSYIPPFLLLLVIPFRNAVDFRGIQVQMCADMLNITAALAEDGVQVYADHVADLASIATGGVTLGSWWPGKVGTLAQTLLESYAVALPDDLCDQEPAEWGPRIREALTDKVLADENGTCGWSKDAMEKLDKTIKLEIADGNARIEFGPVTAELETDGSDCPAACGNCTQACLPHLMRLAALSSVYGTKALKDMSLGKVADKCWHCVSRSSNLQCPLKCTEVKAELDQQAILGRVPPPGRMCIQLEDMADFELLLQVGTQTAYWHLLLGMVYAGFSMATLLPLAFSLMLGAAKGAGIAKSLIPYSRVPTVVSAAAAVFTFPFVLMIMIIVQNVVGNWLTLVGIILILIAFLLSMKPGKLKAESEKDVKDRTNLISKVSAVVLVIALIVFIVVLFTSDLAGVMYAILQDTGINVTTDDLAALGSQTTWTIINTICTVFGKSLLSTVFFTDAVVWLMYHFHHGEDTDDFFYQCARTKLVRDLEPLYAKQNANAVGPEPTSKRDLPPPDVTVAQLNQHNQATLEARIRQTAQAQGQTNSLSDRIRDLESIRGIVDQRMSAALYGDSRTANPRR